MSDTSCHLLIMQSMIVSMTIRITAVEPTETRIAVPILLEDSFENYENKIIALIKNRT